VIFSVCALSVCASRGERARVKMGARKHNPAQAFGSDFPMMVVHES